MARIGMLDSGVGGTSVLALARHCLPGHEYVYVADQAFCPYGTKAPEIVAERVDKLCDELVADGCEAVLLACNTATASAVDALRARLAIPIIGIEPALRPAREAADERPVWVLATEATLGLARFVQLEQRIQGEFWHTPAPELVEVVEGGGDIAVVVASLMARTAHDLNQAGAVVLGCTHFCFARPALEAALPGVPVFDGNEGTVRRLGELMGPGAGEGRLTLRSTAGGAATQKLEDFYWRHFAN